MEVCVDVFYKVRNSQKYGLVIFVGIFLKGFSFYDRDIRLFKFICYFIYNGYGDNLSVYRLINVQ